MYRQLYNNLTFDVVLSGTSIIVGVTSWGIDPNCAGPGFGYRIDIAESPAFLNGFLP
jgi:hypothetical protein